MLLIYLFHMHVLSSALLLFFWSSFFMSLNYIQLSLKIFKVKSRVKFAGQFIGCLKKIFVCPSFGVQMMVDTAVTYKKIQNKYN